MNKLASLLFLSLLVSGCSILPTELEFKPFHKSTFPPRDGKAKLTTDKSMQLISQGYVLLGYIDLKQNLIVCYPDTGCQKIRDLYQNNFDDDDDDIIAPSTAYPREEELAYEVSNYGGDKYSLLDEKDIRETVSKQVCTYWYTTSYTIEGNTYYNTNCGGYRTVFGTLDTKIKRALVWRLNPELAVSEDNITALKQALQTITEKNNSE